MTIPNYFTDVIIANGIACETYGNRIKDQCRGKRNLGYLMRSMFDKVKSNNNKDERQLIEYKEFENLYNQMNKITGSMNSTSSFLKKKVAFHK